MGTVILVPWRGGEERREWNWKVVRPYLERFGWPIFTGDSEGPWSRAAAVNAAAKAAGDWDAALIADADTIPEMEPVQRAVAMVGMNGGAIRPHDTLWNLKSWQSTQLAQQGIERLHLNHKTKTNPGGGLLVISREAWDTVGGYDERYVTWGHEDSDIHTRLLAEASWDRIPGQAWHLYHPRDTTKTPEVLRNREMMRQTQERYRAVIERESEKRGWDVGAHL